MDEEQFDKRLGAVVQRERSRAGISPAEMATALGMSRSGYNRYETGGRPIKSAVLARIASAVGKNPGDLIDEAATGSPEFLPESSPYPLNGDRLRALVDEGKYRSQKRTNLAGFARSADQAVRLVHTLISAEPESARRILAANINPDFIHVLRFLFANDERLGSDNRVLALHALMSIYRSRPVTNPEDQRAHAQAAYFLAASGWQQARKFIETAYRAEEDRWIRRSMIRGLAKSQLRTSLAEDHESALISDKVMQQVDVGFWRFYSGDEPHLIDALNSRLPRSGYGRTINLLLLNVLGGGERADRRFDLRSLATVLQNADARSIRSQQRELVQKAVDEKPPEDSAVPAWQDLRSTAEQYQDWIVLAE